MRLVYSVCDTRELTRQGIFITTLHRVFSSGAWVLDNKNQQHIGILHGIRAAFIESGLDSEPATQLIDLLAKEGRLELRIECE